MDASSASRRRRSSGAGRRDRRAPRQRRRACRVVGTVEQDSMQAEGGAVDHFEPAGPTRVRHAAAQSRLVDGDAPALGECVDHPEGHGRVLRRVGRAARSEGVQAPARGPGVHDDAFPAVRAQRRDMAGVVRRVAGTSSAAARSRIGRSPRPAAPVTAITGLDDRGLLTPIATGRPENRLVVELTFVIAATPRSRTFVASSSRAEPDLDDREVDPRRASSEIAAAVSASNSVGGPTRRRRGRSRAGPARWRRRSRPRSTAAVDRDPLGS